MSTAVTLASSSAPRGGGSDRRRRFLRLVEPAKGTAPLQDGEKRHALDRIPVDVTGSGRQAAEPRSRPARPERRDVHGGVTVQLVEGDEQEVVPQRPLRATDGGDDLEAAGRRRRQPP